MNLFRTSIAGMLLTVGALVLFGQNAAAQAPGADRPEPERISETPDSTSPGRGDRVDSLYIDGRLVRIPVWVSDEVRKDSVRLIALIDSMLQSRDARIRESLAFDPAEWQPTAADRARREADIARSQDRDWIYPSNVTRIPLASVPLSSIGQVLGIIEDTSPRFSYQLTRTREVSVRIYSQNAFLISTLADTVQRPGEYNYEWDFTDSNGRRVLAGNYFAEVIADSDSLIVRKRIVAP